MSILSGYRVVDCTVAMAGPFAAQRLGDLGADVIKLEPTTGEWQRHAAAGGTGRTSINASFLSLNRNKRSLALDLKHPDGQSAARRVLATADVFIQNYRPGVAERLGLDFESVRAINPAIIYVSISGYGATGPYAKLPGQDLLLQALSGAMYSTGSGDLAPQPGGTYLVDAATAYCAFEGALAALLHRERTGEGQYVEVNMLDAVIALQMQELSVFTISGVPQRRTHAPHAHVYIRAPYGVFKTSNGFLALAMPPLKRLAEAMDEPELSAFDEERDGFTRRDEIHAIVARGLLLRTTEAWLALFRERDIWSGPVHDFASLVDDEQVRHNGSFVEYDHHIEGPLKTPGFPIRFARTPSVVRFGAPGIGEHSVEILKEHGFETREVDALVAAGVVAT